MRNRLITSRPLSIWQYGISRILVFTLLSGCAAFRLHDAGSLTTTQQALEATKSIQESGFSAFSAMEQTLDAVAKARSKVDDVLDDTVLKTFETQFPNLTSEHIATQLQYAVEDHAEARNAIERALNQASQDIKSSLEQQNFITQLLDGGSIPRADPETVAKAISNRVGLIAKVAKQLRNEADAEGESSFGQDTIAAIRNILKAPASDPRVKEVHQLFVQVKEEAILAETKRLGEMKRYLATLQNLKEEFDVRHGLWKELFPVVTALIPPEKLQEFDQKGGFEFCTPDCQEEKAFLIEKKPRDWPTDKSTLIDFVSANLNENLPSAEREAALKAVTALGILLFVEQPRDIRTEIAANAEWHRYSIRISKLNAEQRMTLISQIVQGLQAYHEGGVKPEEVAQLALLAGQVGALSFIGARQ